MNTKYIFSILAIVFLCLVSCHNIEEITGDGKCDDNVYISAEFSDKTVDTRSVSIPATHKLRCIIEVWTKGQKETLSYREEVAVEAGSIPEFEFSLPNGDYECLMWADCIEKDAETTLVEISGGVTYEHFSEVYYDTNDLHQITIKEKAAQNLFDTDLCDAFFARIDLKKGSGNVSEKLKLKRPFAKLVVKENEADKFAELQKMKVVYTVPSGFNVSTEEPLPTTLRAEYEKDFADHNTQVLFTNYIFASSGTGSLGKMNLLFTTANEIGYDVEEGTIPIRRNELINASGNLIASGTIKPEEPVGDPQIGDYFFINGTWSSSLTDENKENCIGIVFAIGQQEGDDISAYGEAGTGKQILGYVMALKNTGTGSRPAFYNGATSAQRFAGIAGAALEAEKEKFNGYANTRSFLASELYKNNADAGVYPALTAFETWKKNAPKSPNASDWYIPSFNQLIKMIGGCYGYSNYGDKEIYKKNVEKIAILESTFKYAITSAIAEDFVPETRERPVQCSTVQANADVLVVRYNPTVPYVQVKTETSSTGYIRPILTILK